VKALCRSITILVLLAGHLGYAAGDVVRARAASDLDCKSVKVKDWGSKIEVRGCGRNAEYERRAAGALEPVMIEREVTPAIRQRVMSDLQCTTNDLDIDRMWQRGPGEQVLASGCGREASYDLEGDVLKVVRMTLPASTDLVTKISADLDCVGAKLEVTVTREGDLVTAGAHSCKDGRYQAYSIEPFARLTDNASPAMLTLAKLAARDLACDANQLVMTSEATTKDPVSGQSTDADKVQVDGCRRRAMYQKNSGSYMLSSGPVDLGPAPQRSPELQALVKLAARDLGCDENKLALVVDEKAKATVDGCGRRATYVKQGAAYELSSGPVQTER